jgi:hypothetical protein
MSSRYPVQVRDIFEPRVPHEHDFCDATGDKYLCPVPGCWWNQDGDDDA